jgi:hypothetical protein
VLKVCYERISVEPFREPPDPRPRRRDSLADTNRRKRDETAQVVKERRP